MQKLTSAIAHCPIVTVLYLFWGQSPVWLKRRSNLKLFKRRYLDVQKGKEIRQKSACFMMQHAPNS